MVFARAQIVVSHQRAIAPLPVQAQGRRLQAQAYEEAKLQKECIEYAREELGLLVVPSLGGLSYGLLGPRIGSVMKEHGYEAGTWDLLLLEVRASHECC